MKLRNFFIFSFLQWVFFTALKVGFFNYQIFANQGTETVAFWLATAVIAAAMVRRLGVISYMEAIFIMVLWTVGDAFVDLLITSLATGLEIFSSSVYWASLGIMDVVIFVVHKKRHVKVRHELHAKAHGHTAHDPHKKH